MQRIQSGEVAAFEELCHRYRDLVYNVALKVVAQPMWAEDVTQVVFLNLWSRRMAFRGGSFERWIARVARNRAVDERRRGGAAIFVELSFDVADEQAADDRILTLLEARRLRGLLHVLDERQRLLIELNFFGGMTHLEIAARTGLCLGTVKTRIRSGVLRLRAAYLEPQERARVRSRRPKTY